MSNVDICSIKTYHEILDSGYIGDKQAQVLKIFIESHPRNLTATELVKRLGRGTSENIRNRITELTDMGYLKKTIKIYCPYALERGVKRLVNTWVYTGRVVPKKKIQMTTTCPCCKGEGVVLREQYVDDPREDLFE